MAVHVGCKEEKRRGEIAGSFVVDQQYLNETGEPASLLGLRLPITPDEIRRLADLVGTIDRNLIALLPVP